MLQYKSQIINLFSDNPAQNLVNPYICMSKAYETYDQAPWHEHDDVRMLTK